ncbi:hypothetical protein [Roseovarius tolerans]|uniref:hypothetical protein n=1 Tax=Roseovarius tolerans TaxID=74031 RepID=UPI00067E9978|nr:hypothetical protein [Roseovarius tolerans]
MTYFQSLSAAGFAATAISFGPGRMGFGLFVPEFKEAFAMSDTTVGLVSGLGFLGFFVALLLAQAMLGRAGPRAPVTLGLWPFRRRDRHHLGRPRPSRAHAGTRRLSGGVERGLCLDALQ